MTGQKQKSNVPERGKEISPENIHLVAGKGGTGRGGGQEGKYWHVYVNEKRVGYIYINRINEPPLGEHASIQLHINKGQRGKHIGRTAYRLATEQSEYNEVIAHMRKSNVASRRAAEAAGFQVVPHDQIAQLAMIWRRERKE